MKTKKYSCAKCRPDLVRYRTPRTYIARKSLVNQRNKIKIQTSNIKMTNQK